MIHIYYDSYVFIPNDITILTFVVYNLLDLKYTFKHTLISLRRLWVCRGDKSDDDPFLFLLQTHFWPSKKSTIYRTEHQSEKRN